MTNLFSEYQVVRLISETPSIPVSRGAIGTVLIVYAGPPPAFEVEFFDEHGKTIGTFTVAGSDLAATNDHDTNK